MGRIKRYSELIRIPGFFDRYNYLKLTGKVGEDTFGFDRYLNQVLYRTPVWKKVRQEVILRDQGFDLGDPDRPISGAIIVHHMNPITVEDVRKERDEVFDPEYLISCSLLTHNAIHYGTDSLLEKPLVERTPGDTCPWR